MTREGFYRKQADLFGRMTCDAMGDALANYHEKPCVITIRIDDAVHYARIAAHFGVLVLGRES